MIMHRLIHNADLVDNTGGECRYSLVHPPYIIIPFLIFLY